VLSSVLESCSDGIWSSVSWFVGEGGFCCTILGELIIVQGAKFGIGDVMGRYGPKINGFSWYSTSLGLTHLGGLSSCLLPELWLEYS